MERLPETTGNLDVALDAFAKGYPVVAMKPRSKEPAQRWKHLSECEMTEESVYQRWENNDNGIAILCLDLVIFDVESANKLDFVIDKTGLKNAPICQTPGGGYHVHARLRRGVELDRKIKLKGQPIDLLTKNSLSIIPNSIGENGVPYQWVGPGLPPKNELPFANIGWTRTRRRWAKMPTISGDTMGNIGNTMGAGLIGDQVNDIRAYIRRIPSIQGQHGNKGMFRVCCLLAERFRFDQALMELESWNEDVAVPVWSREELIRALTSACKRKIQERLR